MVLSITSIVEIETPEYAYLYLVLLSKSVIVMITNCYRLLLELGTQLKLHTGSTYIH